VPDRDRSHTRADDGRGAVSTSGEDTQHLQEQIQSCMVQRQNLEAIFDSVADGIIAVDVKGRVMNLNRAAGDITGYERVEAVGSSCADVLGLAPGNPLCPVFENRQQVDERTASLTDRRGRDRHVIVSTRVLRDEAGVEHGMVAILRDVTELESMRDELRGRDQLHGLVGSSHPMRQIYQLVEDLSDSDATVLILGESGTGKELVAAAIHHCSHRRQGPFVKVNCSALSEGLLESELFGHVRGAFTGAIRDKVGRFEQASEGTIFLDEIGDLTTNVQTKLLRVLQEREIERVGSGETLVVDCRIIAATHRDLPHEIAAGRFRDDLYYRLNVMPIELPPLRQRTEDIPRIVAHFIDKQRAATGRPIHRIDSEALGQLMDYPWPGNIRELENAIAHAFIKCRGEAIRGDCLPGFVTAGSGPGVGRRPDRDPSAGEAAAGPGPGPRDPGEGDEKARIVEALRASQWRRTDAARRLGIHRTTLWRKMREWGLE